MERGKVYWFRFGAHKTGCMKGKFWIVAFVICEHQYNSNGLSCQNLLRVYLLQKCVCMYVYVCMRCAGSLTSTPCK